MVDAVLHHVASLLEAIVSDLLTGVVAHLLDTMATKDIADVLPLPILHVETITKTTHVVLPHRDIRNPMHADLSLTHAHPVHDELEAMAMVVATAAATKIDVIES